MTAKGQKKIIVGKDRTHSRIQIDIPDPNHTAYKLWCAINGTDMTRDINEYIASRIEGFVPPKPSKKK